MCPLPPSMSPKEAAHLLNMTDRGVRKWCEAGKVPARRVGDRWVINVRAMAERNPDTYAELVDRWRERRAACAPPSRDMTGW